MKTLGLLGGLSWESSREYYRLLNEQVRREKGGLHSAPIILHSFDFQQIADLQKTDWQALALLMGDAAEKLEQSGVQGLAICSNYMHRCAEAVSQRVRIPLLHIVDVMAEAIHAQSYNRVGLLGAKGTMEHPFYRSHLERHGIEMLVPQQEERDFIDQSIFSELCRGIWRDETRARYEEILSVMAAQGAQGVILGCTEIEQLLTVEHSSIPLFPSAKLHAEALGRWILTP